MKRRLIRIGREYRRRNVNSKCIVYVCCCSMLRRCVCGARTRECGILYMNILMLLNPMIFAVCAMEETCSLKFNHRLEIDSYKHTGTHTHREKQTHPITILTWMIDSDRLSSNSVEQLIDDSRTKFLRLIIFLGVTSTSAWIFRIWWKWFTQCKW